MLKILKSKNSASFLKLKNKPKKLAGFFQRKKINSKNFASFFVKKSSQKSWLAAWSATVHLKNIFFCIKSLWIITTVILLEVNGVIKAENSRRQDTCEYN